MADGFFTASPRQGLWARQLVESESHRIINTQGYADQRTYPAGTYEIQSKDGRPFFLAGYEYAGKAFINPVAFGSLFDTRGS